jgi:hypothetical protein
LCIGCGLGDYEELLRKNRQQAKGGDEDRKLLGDALELPTIKEGDTTAPMLTAADVFLRPPKLFQCKTTPVEVGSDKFAPQVGKSDKTVSMPGKQAAEHLTQLYDYAGAEGCHVLLAAMQSDYLELADADRAIEASEFRRSVEKAFLRYLQQRRLPKEAELPPYKDKKKEELIPPRIGKTAPPPLRFEVWVWEEPYNQAKDAKFNPEAEPARYALYFYQDGMTHAAIIYQFPRSRTNDAALQKGIEASLKSLAVGPDGASRRFHASKKR